MCTNLFQFQDWKGSHWYKEANAAVSAPSEVAEFPRSCCRDQADKCNHRGTIDKGPLYAMNVYNKGCVAAGEEFSMNHLWTLGTVALVIAFVEVTGIVLAINLVRAFRDEEQKQTSTV